MDPSEDLPPLLIDLNSGREDGSLDTNPDLSQPISETKEEEESPEKVPLTIITEFGDSADIEKALTISQNGEQVQGWLELANGCICCSLKDTSLASLENLIASSPTPFSHLLLETSGLANPGNLAPLFWTDAGLGSNVYLDGIVTLVDARNILRSLDEPGEEEVEGHPRAGSGDEKNEGNDDRDGGEEKGTCLGDGGKLLSTAHLQISHADVIILNKADTLAKEDLLAVETRIRSINAIARISITKYAQVPDLEGWVLGLKAYDGVEGLEDMMVQQQEKGKKGHSHLDPSITTISLPLPILTPSQLSRLETFLQSLLWDSTIPGIPSVPLPASTSPSLQPASKEQDQMTTDQVFPPPDQEPPNRSYQKKEVEIHRTKGLLTVFQEHPDDGGGNNDGEEEVVDGNVNARSRSSNSTAENFTYHHQQQQNHNHNDSNPKAQHFSSQTPHSHPQNLPKTPQEKLQDKEVVQSRSSTKNSTTTTTKRLMLQGVREVFEITDLPQQPTDSQNKDAEAGDDDEEEEEDKGEESLGGKLVFIGRGLVRSGMEESLWSNVLR